MTRFRNWLATGCAVPITSALLLSSYTHLDNSYKFLSSIYSYQIVGARTGVLLAAVLPFLQIAISIVLLFDTVGRKAAFFLSSLLFAVFVGAQVSALARGLDISCGCFSSSHAQPIGLLSISLAAGGLILSVVGFFASKRSMEEAKHGT